MTELSVRFRWLLVACEACGWELRFADPELAQEALEDHWLPVVLEAALVVNGAPVHYCRPDS